MAEDDLMDIVEAATYLRVNPQTVYRNLRLGRLPGAKVGRQWRIRRRDLDYYLLGSSLAAASAPVWNAARQTAGADPIRARQTLLCSELDRLVRIIVDEFKPLQIIIFGSYAEGRITAWSDLDLVVVARTDRPFYDRAALILEKAQPRVGVDVMVYTPEEWTQIKKRPFVKAEILRKGRIIYGR